MASARRTRYPEWAKNVKPLVDEQAKNTGPANHAMDSEENQAVFRKIQEWWLQAREAQSFVRLEMDVDENFYHGDQFTAEDRRALEDVGQAALVFNKTKPVVDWLIGTERRTRVDFNVLPRHKGQEKSAQVKKDVLKYINDISKGQFAFSDASREAFISGLGWIEVGVRGDNHEMPLYLSQESWRNMWYDPLGAKKDTSDWRYLFRSKWLDLDIAQAMFPSRAEELKTCATSVGVDLTTDDDDEFYLGLRFSHRDRHGHPLGIPSYTDFVSSQVNNRRERVRLVECWYRLPMRGQKVKGGKHHGRVVNLRNQRMMHELNADIRNGIASVYDAVVMQVYCAVFCENVLLQNMVSPYHHNRFPFVPLWAYRKGKFHEPYGVVRNCRDPQEDLNKRYSKALFLLSSTRIIADRNAVQDWEEIRSEVPRPDAQLLLDTPGARFEIHEESALAEEQVKLVEHDGLHIQEISGVTSENLGRDTNAISGRAVLAKQTQGSVVSAELFDNIRQGRQLVGEIMLSVAEQFIDQPMAIRITGERGAIQWHDINQEGGVNDITATQMDYVISEQDFRDTMKQAMYDSLMDAVSKMDPQISIQLLDAVVDLADFPGKDELVARIRKINGQTPPPEQMTEADKQAAAERQAMEQQAAAVKQKAIQLEFAEKQAKIDKTTAEADRIRAEIPTLGVDGKVRGEMEAKLRAVEEKARIDQAALNEEIRKNVQELSNQRYEIDKKAETEIEVAKIKAAAEDKAAAAKGAAEVEVARIQAGANIEAQAAAGETADQLAALQSQVDFHKNKAADASKSADQERARAEQQKQDAEKRSAEQDQKSKDAEEKHRKAIADAQDKVSKERKAHEDALAKSRKDAEDRIAAARKESADRAAASTPAAGAAQPPVTVYANGGPVGPVRRKGKIVKKNGEIHFEIESEGSSGTQKAGSVSFDKEPKKK